LALVVTAAAPAATTQWKPEQAVELVVGSAPGSGPDRNARFMQSVLQKLKYFDSPITVVNRAGAGSAISGLYVNKFEGNGHYVLLSGKALVVSDLMGRLPFQYTDLTPLAHLMDESGGRFGDEGERHRSAKSQDGHLQLGRRGDDRAPRRTRRRRSGVGGPPRQRAPGRPHATVSVWRAAFGPKKPPRPSPVHPSLFSKPGLSSAPPSPSSLRRV
jgi:hypothetical protein